MRALRHSVVVVVPALFALAWSASASAAPLVVNGANSPFTIAADSTFDSLTVQSGGTLVVNATLTVTAGADIQAGGVVTTAAKNTAMKIIVGTTLLVEAGGLVEGAGLGFKGGSNGSAFGGSGETLDPITLNTIAGPGRSNGGSHGGDGGDANGAAAGSPVPFDVEVSPFSFGGGGGGDGSCGGKGGNGGGKLVLVANTVQIDGTVRADGQAGVNGCPSGGGGGGGTIVIQATTWSGTGSITAIGGAGGSGAGGGGGGRVFAQFTTRTYSGGLSAGGGVGAVNGVAGTSYLLDASGALTAQGGRVFLGDGDTFPSVTLGVSGEAVLSGTQTVTQQMTVPAGTTITIASDTALTNTSINGTIGGTLHVVSPIAFPTSITLDGTLIADEHLAITGNLTLDAGSLVTESAHAAAGVLDASGTINIKTGAIVDINGKGLNINQTFDPLTLQLIGVARSVGGSHGGHGGFAAANITYDDPRNPQKPGGGGGSDGSCGGTAGTGGGVLAILAGTLQIDGTLRADGNGGTNGCPSGGGGGGGSLFIQVGTLSGTNGLVTAKGGLGGSNAGGGGGGRIAIFATAKTFSGQISAQGGAQNGSGLAGADGTVFIELAGGALVSQGGFLPLAGGDSFTSVTMLAAGTLALSGPAVVSSTVVVAANSTVELDSSDALTSVTLSASLAGKVVVNAGITLPTTTVASTGSIVVNDALSVNGNLTVQANGLITHAPLIPASSLDVSGTFDVQVAGVVDVGSKGFLPGPNAGFGGSGATINPATQQLAAGSPRGVGASHGGVGGSGAPINSVYDDPDAPHFLGAGGGGDGSCNGVGGTGGGAMLINAGTLKVNGSMSAGGGAGSNGCPSGGGGAGGTFNISAGTLTGSGIIAADGGAGGSAAGGGGGGRIHVTVTTSNTFSGLIHANGGGNGAQGSVAVVNPGAQTLVVSGGVTVVDGSDSFTNVTLQPGGVLDIQGPTHITNAVTIVAGSRVILESSDALTNVTLAQNLAGTLVTAAPITLQPVTVQSGGTLIVDDDTTVNGNLTVLASGTVTHDAGITLSSLDVTGTFDVRLAATVDISGKGLIGGPNAGFGGSGATISTITQQIIAGSPRGVGGSHGGLGAGGGAGAVYDDADAPHFLGAGGGGDGSCNGVGGNGGGLTHISAASLIVNGIIHADGTGGSNGCPSGGGGAGGTLTFVVGSWSGTGVITADGGAPGSAAGGGAGGRIRVDVTTNTFSGVIEANGNGAGQQGTVNIVNAGAQTLVVQGGVYAIDGGDTFSSITLGAGGVLQVLGAAHVTSPITVTAGSRLVLASSDALQAITLTSTVAGIVETEAAITLPALTFNAGATLIVDEDTTVQGNLTILNGGIVTHDPGVVVSSLDVTGTFDVRLGAVVSITGKGLREGPNAGFGGSGAAISLLNGQVVAGSPRGVGGSHGGVGAGAGPNPAYDDPDAPHFLGAGGGGDGSCNGIGGAGGGLMHIAAGTLIVNGLIHADGAGGTNGCPSGGGGAGGALQFTVTSFQGSGGISADGGAGGSGSGGGGGGLIQMSVTNNTFTGFIEANGSGTATQGNVNIVNSGAQTLVVAGGVYTIDGNDSFTSVTMGLGGVLDVEGPAQVQQPIHVTTGSRVILSSTDALSALDIDPSVDGTLQFDADTQFPDDIVVNGTLVVNALLTAPNINVKQSALITHDIEVTTSQIIVGGILDMDPGSRVDVSSKGFHGGNTFGAVFGARGGTIDPLTLLVAAGSGRGNGGSHAALGGVGQGNQALAAVYDDPAAPIYAGGGGGADGSCGAVAGSGGGILRISAATLIEDGTIASDGGVGGSGCPGGGGGAGGTVILSLGAWEGAGVLSAVGGAGGSGQGGGSGGLIVVSYAVTPRGFSGAINVGGGGGVVGAAGTFTEQTVTAPPSIVSVAPTGIEVGRVLRYQPVATGSPPLTWRFTQAPVGATIDAQSGLVLWFPPDTTPQTFIIHVDNALGADEQIFTVTPTSAPFITSSPTSTAIAGQPYHYDADDAASASGTPPLVWSAVSAPPGFSIDSSTGVITYTPASPGTEPACIKATNAQGASAQCFQIVVTSPSGATAPTITSTASLVGFIGSPYAYDADATAEATGDAPIVWTTLLAPPGFGIDPQSGIVDWTPDAAGPQGVCIVASNAAGEDTQCFTVDVQLAGPPVFTSRPATLALQGAAYAYDLDGKASVSGAGPITFSAPTAPTGFAIDASTGLVTWTPPDPGNFDVVIEATNAQGATDQSFTVSVNPSGAGAAPVIAHSANGVAAVGIPYVYDDDGVAAAGGDAPITWTVTTAPTGFAIDPASGLVTWVPQDLGTQNVTLHAANAIGSDDYSFTVNVVESVGPIPTAVATLTPPEGNAPLDVVADGTQSFGPPGDAIAFYRWSFGDGTPLATTSTATHEYERAGSYVARLRVADALGAGGEAAVVVSVLDNGVRPPTARILEPQLEGNDSLDVSFSCDCHAGDAPIEAFLWDFGDGTQSDLEAVAHTFGPGGFEVRLTVVDANGLTATDTVQVKVSDAGNQPPLIDASALPAFGASPLTVAFLATFGDVDGSVTGVAWDFGDGGTSTDAAPSYTYANAGTYFVSATVTDDKGLASTATLEIDVSSPSGAYAPQILSLPITTGAAGVAYSYDADGLPAARGDRPLTWTLGKNVGGTVVGAPAGMTIDATSGAVTWTPTTAQIGDVPVTLVATNDAASVAQDFIVTVSGTKPGKPPKPTPAGCGCGVDADGAPEGAALVLLAVSIRRRGKRG